MIINGKDLAAKIFEDLKKRTRILAAKGIVPHLYIILLSSDDSSSSYVKQKILRGEEVGVKISVDKESPNIQTEELVRKIEKLNQDENIHGIIVQRPMPKQINEDVIAKSVDPKKDIDGFNSNSKFGTPVAQAVLTLLKTIHPKDFQTWLKSQNIAVIGKGVTAGKPIIKSLENLGIKPAVISSQTQNPKALLQKSDIVISAVGKANVIDGTNVKKGAIVIGVGMHRETDGKFHGDFDEEKIQNVASYYSPTPGGVGPVNVACLIKNLIEAAQSSLPI